MRTIPQAISATLPTPITPKISTSATAISKRSQRRRCAYPFGYGLSYTTFSVDPSLTYAQQGAEICVKVKNTGNCAGRCVVEAYVQKPFGKDGNPKRELVGFYKTGLLPAGGEEEAVIPVPVYRVTTYDEETSSEVLLGGEYVFFAGEDVRSAKEAGRVTTEGRVLRHLAERGAPRMPFSVFRAEDKGGEYALIQVPVRLARSDVKAEMAASIPPESLWEAHTEPCTFEDVRAGKVPLRAFVSQLSFDELEAVSRGDYKMNSPLGPEATRARSAACCPLSTGKGCRPSSQRTGLRASA